MFKFLRRNSKGNQKAIMIALLGVAIILVVLVVIDMTKKSPIVNQNPQTVQTNQTGPTDDVINYDDVTNMPAAEKNNFKAEVAADTVVPEVSTELSDAQKKEIAVPVVVVPAAPGSSSKFRSFQIRAENDTFTPTKVIANSGDTVHIDFTAVDKNYDIIFPGYNMMQSAKTGETKILEFQALRTGDFTYYCPSCGGPTKGPTGHIIIVP